MAHCTKEALFRGLGFRRIKYRLATAATQLDSMIGKCTCHTPKTLNPLIKGGCGIWGVVVGESTSTSFSYCSVTFEIPDDNERFRKLLLSSGAQQSF